MPSPIAMGARSLLVVPQAAEQILATEASVEWVGTLGAEAEVEARYYGCGLAELGFTAGDLDSPPCLPPTGRGLLRRGEEEWRPAPLERLASRACGRCEADRLWITSTHRLEGLGRAPKPVAAALLPDLRLLLAVRREDAPDELVVVTPDGSWTPVEVHFDGSTDTPQLSGLAVTRDAGVWVATPERVWFGRLELDGRLSLVTSLQDAPGITAFSTTILLPSEGEDEVWVLGGRSCLWRRRSSRWEQVAPPREELRDSRRTGLAPHGPNHLIAIGVGSILEDVTGEPYTEAYWRVDRESGQLERFFVARAQNEEPRSVFGEPEPGGRAWIGGQDGVLRQVGEFGPANASDYPAGLDAIIGTDDRLLLAFDEGAGVQQVFFDENLDEPCRLSSTGLPEPRFLLRTGNRLVSVSEQAGQVTWLQFEHHSRCALAAMNSE